MTNASMKQQRPGLGIANGRRRRGTPGWLGLAVPLLLVVAIGVFVSPRFLTVNNLINVLNGASLVGIVVVGMTFVMISGGMADLSVPATVAVGAIVVLKAQGFVGDLPAIALAASLAGIAGLASGLLIGYAKANPIIVTLGLGIIVLGLAQITTGGAIIYGTASPVTDFLRGRLLGVPALVLVFALVAVAGHLLLARSVWGRWTYAVGGNNAAAEASAVPAKRTVAAAFVLTGLLSGLCGSLLGLTLLQARPIVGTGYEFDAITAVVVGGISLMGGVGSIPRAMAGLLLVALVNNVLTLAGVPTPAQGLAKGIIIAAAVAADVYTRRRGGRA